MVYEPRISSEHEPQIQDEKSSELSGLSSNQIPSSAGSDTAVYSVPPETEDNILGIDHHSRSSLSHSVEYPTRSAQGSNILSVTLLAFGLFVIILGSVWVLRGAGNQLSAIALFLFGEGGAHMTSQACTIALFCWGLCATLVSIAKVNEERQVVESLRRVNSLSPRAPNTPLANTFYTEARWGLSKVSSYLECRAVIEEARERLIERLDGETRGSAAVMWLIPLSGFLGTVIGMSLTIGRFDELFASASGEAVKLIGLTDLAPAIQGLSTAFDTTLLALALVIPLKLVMVVRERRAEQLVNELEDKVGELLLIDRLSNEREALREVNQQALRESLSVLDDQSAALRRTLIETSEYLVAIRDQLSEHRALTSQSNQVSDRKMHEASLELLRELSRHQVHLGEQVLALKAATETPLIIQRAPYQSQEG